MKKDLWYSTTGAWNKNFSFTPIRSKYDLIARLLEVSKYVISRKTAAKNESIEILVSKNSRVYVFDNDAYFYSFSFPFSIQLSSDVENCNKLFFHGGEITSAIINSLMYLLNYYNEKGLFSLKDALNDISEFDVDLKIVEQIWMSLLTFDSGYVRYECDAKHEKPNHPLFHLDWNFEDRCEVKTGLKSALTKKEFAEILSVDSPCWFLHKPNKNR